MRIVPGPLPLCLFILTLAAAECSAQSPPAADAPTSKVDRYGDPLPSGAIQRLGTIRMRHGDTVIATAFAPDGKSLASCSDDSYIRFWDVATGRPTRRLWTGPNRTWMIAFSSDGSRLAAAAEGGELTLWDLATNKPLWKALPPNKQGYEYPAIHRLQFSADGVVLATSDYGGSVRVWDAASGRQLWEQPFSTRRGRGVRPFALSPDGNMLAIGNVNSTVELWDLIRGGAPRLIQPAHAQEVLSMAFAPNGKSLVTSGVAQLQRLPNRRVRIIGEIFIWDVEKLEKSAELKLPEEALGVSTVTFSRDGTLLASSHENCIVVWNLATREPLRTIQVPQEHSGVSISPDNRLIAAAARGASKDNEVLMWDIKSGEPALPQPPMHGDEITTVATSRDGKWIATGSSDNSVRVWNAITGEHVRKLDDGTGWLRYVEFAPNGEWLALGRETYEQNRVPSYQGEVKFVRLADGAVLQHYLVPERVICGAMSPDGSQVAVAIGLEDDEMMERMAGGGAGGGERPPMKFKALVWDAELGGQVAEFESPKGQITCLAYSSDGNQLLAACRDMTTCTWNLQTRGEVKPLPFDEPRNRSLGAEWLPGGQRFVVSYHDRVEGRNYCSRLVMRERERVEPIWERVFPDSRTWTLSASPDGKLLAVYLHANSGTTAKNRLVICSAEDGRERLTLDAEDGSVRSMAFSVDGTKLITGMLAGDTLVWDVSAARADK